jgi:hypothetical protein
MRRNATHTIGLILPNISNPFYSELAHAVESVAQEHNCLVTYGNTNYHAQLTARYLDAFADRRVDGVIVAACTDEDMEVLQGYDAPIVVVDAHTAAATSGFPLVEVENVPAARELVAHLIRLGHRRIGDNHDRLTRNGVGPAERALAARPDKAPRRPRLTCLAGDEAGRARELSCGHRENGGMIVASVGGPAASHRCSSVQCRSDGKGVVEQSCPSVGKALPPSTRWLLRPPSFKETYWLCTR